MIDDQIDELLGRVEAAAVLAGVGIGPDGDLAGVTARRLPLQEPLVDRAELLDGHVAVVDEAAPGARVPGMAQAVDDRGDLRVGEPDPFQQRGGLGGEQSAVVGRQADGGVALVDEFEQGHQPVVVVAGDRGVGVLVGHPAGDVVPDPLSQAIVVVANVIDRQQAPVLGVEDEEQPIEEDEGGLPDLGEGSRRMRRQAPVRGRGRRARRRRRRGPGRSAPRTAGPRLSPTRGRWSSSRAGG